jgi:hypothetical protein
MFIIVTGIDVYGCCAQYGFQKPDLGWGFIIGDIESKEREIEYNVSLLMTIFKAYF